MLWDINSGLLRLVLRIYFIASLTILGIIGRQCCKLASKVDLLRGNKVRIHRMTGWLQARDVFVVIFKLKELPGGWWLGLMMIITSALSLTADLAVARLVQAIDGASFCLFDQGLVMDWAGREDFAIPPQNSWVATVASNVQYYSLSNGCWAGVYRKVPGNQTFAQGFCGQDADILGGWTCSDLHNDQSFPPSASVQKIATSLYDSKLQYYDDDRIAWTDYGTADNQTTHLAIWSSSALFDDAHSAFDVIVSADLNAAVTDVKVMKTFRCLVDPQSSNIGDINQILSQMRSVSTLVQWAPGLEAVLYSGNKKPLDLEIATFGLEIYLNGMTMVQGGNNNIVSKRLSTDDNPFYGCLSPKADINPAIVGMVVFAGLILLITTLYWLYLLIIVGRAALSRKTSGVARKTIKPIPDSTLSWVLQAARENAMSTQNTHGEQDGTIVSVPQKERDLRDWSFAITDGVAGVARVVRQREGFSALTMNESTFQQSYYHEGK